VYNGHKRVHGLKFQSIVIPNGLIANLFGPIEGRRHDSFLLRESGLLPQLERMFDDEDNMYYVYGDPAYPLMPQLMYPFRGANITPEQQDFNHRAPQSPHPRLRTFGAPLYDSGFAPSRKILDMALPSANLQGG
jgi:hypothetical protein